MSYIPTPEKFKSLGFYILLASEGGIIYQNKHQQLVGHDAAPGTPGLTKLLVEEATLNLHLPSEAFFDQLLTALGYTTP